MINIKISHNIDELLDKVAKLQNDIQMQIADAQTSSLNEIQNLMVSQNRDAAEEISVDVQTDGTNFEITIDGVDYDYEYQINNKNIDELSDDIISIIEDKINQSLDGGN